MVSRDANDSKDTEFHVWLVPSAQIYHQDFLSPSFVVLHASSNVPMKWLPRGSKPTSYHLLRQQDELLFPESLSKTRESIACVGL